jgi:hypothetical protein
MLQAINRFMKTEPIPALYRDELLLKACNGALVLGRNLNYLLDAYDFYVQRYTPETAQQTAELEDLEVSIYELGTLPKHVAEAIKAWRSNTENMLSRSGFEIYILNEFNLHLNAISTFMARKHIDLENFQVQQVGQAFLALKNANNAFTLLG